MHAGVRWFCFLAVCFASPSRSLATGASELFQRGLAAEERLDSRAALELFLAEENARPGQALVLQKIAQQYSDLTVELAPGPERKRLAQLALDYAGRAVAVEPRNAVNVLSLAICYGKIAADSDTRAKLEYSRLVKAEAERAIALDPNYAWAHHVLGRWHLEVANLGTATKWLVRAIYGGLPPASIKEAVASLRRAVELEPGELAHHLELGFAYLAAGEREEARKQFSAGLAMPSRRKHDDAAKQRAQIALSGIPP
jgi:tetratricopeptide (TPR) repeat protein